MKHLFLTFTFALAVLFLTSCRKDNTEGVTLTGNWKHLTEYQFPGTPRGGAISFVIDNKAYMGLGYTGGKEYPLDFFVLDLTAGTWKQLKDFEFLSPPPPPSSPPLSPPLLVKGKGRERAVSFAIGGKGYVGLGYNRDDVDKTVEGKEGQKEIVKGLKKGGQDFYSYDPASDTWTKEANFPGTARYDAIGFSLNGKGYVGTGLDERGNFWSDMWQYDPAAKKWDRIGNFPGGKKYRAYALSLGNVAYVGGGQSSGSYNHDFWKFDGTAWTPLKPRSDVAYWTKYLAAVDRSDANIFSINGKIYIVNGVDSRNSINNSCYEWDPSNVNNEWVQKTSFERRERQLAVAFTIGNRAFVCAGQNANQYWDDAAEFRPDEPADPNDN